MSKLRNPSNYKPSVHHNLAKECWGSNQETNKTTKTRIKHRANHNYFENMPPHIALKHHIITSCKCLEEEVKNALYKILDTEFPQELYKPSAIKNLEKFKEGCRKYWWVDYKR